MVSTVLHATVKPIFASVSKYFIQRVVSSLFKYLYKRHNYHIVREVIVLCIKLDTGWRGVISFTLGPLYPRKNIAPYYL